MAVVADRAESRRQLEPRRLLRWAAPAVYVAVLAFVLYQDGIPAARERLLMWIVLGLLAVSITNVRGWARSVVLEWLPFALILWAYDLLAGIRNVNRHRMLSAAEVQTAEPALRQEGLRGAGEFWDCWTNDARLVVETLRSAVDAGAVALSYATVVDFEKNGGRIAGVRVRDGERAREIVVRARVVVNATRRPSRDRAKRDQRATRATGVSSPERRSHHASALSRPGCRNTPRIRRPSG